jgi:polypeptide N-acetylgalactosaminyltransferase
MGKPVLLPQSRTGNLTKATRTKIEAGWKAHGFNEYVSDMISVHRSLPDVRHHL